MLYVEGINEFTRKLKTSWIMLFILIYIGSISLMVSADQVSIFNCSEQGYGRIINSRYSGYKKVLIVKDEKTNQWRAEGDCGCTVESSMNKFYKFLYGDNINNNEIDHSFENESLVYPNGKLYRAELFNEHSGVHFPDKKKFRLGKSRLLISKDTMQTAINALYIIVEGNLDDILSLPPKYVLQSTRTISMMEISYEKMAAMWTVIKDGKPTSHMTYKTLSQFRPLFQHITGREMAKLNFSDVNIINYIGSHPELSRYQLAVVAEAYLKFNPNWTQPSYLNLLNNIVCGMPTSRLKEIPTSSYLRMSEQFFHSVRSCDKLQLNLFATKMMKTEVLGRSYSWGSRDVMKMGLLLDEVDGGDLKIIRPPAMSAITGQVIQKMSLKKFHYLTDQQLKFMGRVPLTILSKRLSGMKNILDHEDGTCSRNKFSPMLLVLYLLVHYIIY